MTAPGRLIAIVGPSGVGKDSVIDALLAARPDLRRIRRAITRAPGLGGEDYDALTEAQFEQQAAAGAFCLHWQAHGLRYGIPQTVLEDVQAGAQVVANLSRKQLAQANAVFPALSVINLTARPETLAARVAGRGRETPQEVAARLARAVPDFPPGLDLHHVSNDGPLDQTVARIEALLHPVRA